MDQKQRPLPVGYKKPFLALNIFLWSTASPSFFFICFEIVHHFMLTLLLGKHIAREMEILNWSSSFPTRSYSSHSPSCTSVQSPTRTSELLNTRKWEIALKWKCWEMNLPCQTASVLFYKSLPFSLASLSFGCVSQMPWK